MAKKRAKRRPLRHELHKPTGDLADTYAPESQYAGLGHIRTKRSVVEAHQKHRFDHIEFQQTPSLADQFHALPGELRELIFSFLLVRPVKWDFKHTDGCPLRYEYTTTSDTRPGPTDCAVCANGAHVREWRLRDPDRPITIFPWVSKWAPEQSNPYVCTRCWEDRLRPKPFPSPKTLPCLCARRTNLDVLLVCKQWYSEAGRVFYSRNTFAFEDSTTLIGFFNYLPQHWKAKVSRVSFMAWHNEHTKDPESSHQLAKVFSVLRSIPQLSFLELDGLFLSRFLMVDRLRRMGLPHARSVRFVLRKPHEIIPARGSTLAEENTFIWNDLAARVLISRGLAEEVARALKGERRAWLRHTKDLVYLIDLHQKLYVRLPHQWDGKDMDGRSLPWHHDPFDRHPDQWSILWEKHGVHASGFLPERTCVP